MDEWVVVYGFGFTALSLKSASWRPGISAFLGRAPDLSQSCAFLNGYGCWLLVEQGPLAKSEFIGAEDHFFAALTPIGQILVGPA